MGSFASCSSLSLAASTFSYCSVWSKSCSASPVYGSSPQWYYQPLIPVCVSALLCWTLFQSPRPSMATACLLQGPTAQSALLHTAPASLAHTSWWWFAFCMAPEVWSGFWIRPFHQACSESFLISLLRSVLLLSRLTSYIILRMVGEQINCWGGGGEEKRRKQKKRKSSILQTKGVWTRNIQREMPDTFLYALKNFQIYSVFTQNILWQILIVEQTLSLFLSSDFWCKTLSLQNTFSSAPSSFLFCGFILH